MKRKIYDQLLLWKNKRKGKSAMMIEGARRVGKSYMDIEQPFIKCLGFVQNLHVMCETQADKLFKV